MPKTEYGRIKKSLVESGAIEFEPVEVGQFYRHNAVNEVVMVYTISRLEGSPRYELAHIKKAGALTFFVKANLYDYVLMTPTESDRLLRRLSKKKKKWEDRLDNLTHTLKLLEGKVN